jgi:ribonuclease-3
MEALLAAVWLDGGIDAVRPVFNRAWADELAAPPKKSLTNPKSALQEWALGQGKPLPAYRIVERKGSDHAPIFTIEVSVAGYPPLTAQGRSRQDAEKAAAIGLLQREGVI